MYSDPFTPVATRNRSSTAVPTKTATANPPGTFRRASLVSGAVHVHQTDFARLLVGGRGSPASPVAPTSDPTVTGAVNGSLRAKSSFGPRAINFQFNPKDPEMLVLPCTQIA